MPFLIDYMCLSCKHVWEILLNHKEEELTNCPKCNSPDIQRQLGGVITKINDPEILKETLKKRSADHTLKELKKKAGYKGTLPPNFGSKGTIS